MQIDDFLAISFVNKKVQQYRQNANPRDLKNLLHLFKENQSKKTSNQKISLSDLSQSTQFKKVANQVQFLGYDNDFCRIFGIYGPLIDKSNIIFLFFIFEKIIQESCFNINKNIKKQKIHETRQSPGVTIVFFNSLNTKTKNTKSAKKIHQPTKIQDFKDEVIKNLRFKYLSKINNILLVFPSFINKSWGYLNSFGFKDGFYSKLFTYSDSIFDLVTILGPLFEYGKLDKCIISKEKSQLSKLSVYSNQQILQSKQQLNFQQQFQPDHQNFHTTFFQYHTKIQHYLQDPKKNISLLITICFQQIQDFHLKFEGLFRKVADQNELRKLQNRLLSYDYDQSNKNTEQKQFGQLEKKIKSQLKFFRPQTITSFIKKVFTQLQDPIFSHEVYTKITQLSWKDLLLNLNNLKPYNQNKNHLFKQRNVIKSSQPFLLNQQKTKNNVKQKIAYFENLSQQNFMMSNSINNSIQSTFSSYQSPTKEKPIRFRKIAQSNLPTVQNIQKLKNHDFLKLDQMQNIFPQQFYLLRETIKLLNKISCEQKFNLMSAKNLAICFNPCFFRSPLSKDNKILCSVQQQFDKQAKLVLVIQKMIEKPQDFFETA